MSTALLEHQKYDQVPAILDFTKYNPAGIVAGRPGNRSSGQEFPLRGVHPVTLYYTYTSQIYPE
jgi:hypothetical protein